ncbi:bifunctional phosphoribosylaminoimidazolecarboxamide formyltransferase/IMP cyclohydrolase [Carnobacteriaceae bacterium zg-ZUI78]|nr:bifunctional phosphoribosylaminoimidazolecarboxamide formyltransferase/IMP cyclohydrolase [Carnobacteriaceae bacterium zg-ZUI78]
MTRALISVSDKTGVVPFAKALVSLGIEIISTGGTKKVLEEEGIKTIGIEEVTGFPEMLDGRVKTLHPVIHGGLLARRDSQEHTNALEEHHISYIDIVVVNLYPFKQTILKPNVHYADAIENIDIGGPSMLRSAAKNHADVTVLVDPADYDTVLSEWQEYGNTRFETRQTLAAKVFRHTASYDALIADYMTKQVGQDTPETLTITYDLKQTLRYGENSQQKALFYETVLPQRFSIANATQLHGKELSYNNIKDADAAIRIAREFNEPVAVALKHMNPCGVGVGETIEEAFERCYQADPVSIFGGIVVLNRPVTKHVAEQLHTIFLEIIIAPVYDEEALEILTQKKNIRLLALPFEEMHTNELEYVSVLGGLLVQEQDNHLDEPETFSVMTKRKPTLEEEKALLLAWKVVKHVKSNAIVISDAKQTLGIGAGQMNRVGAAKIALEQAKQSGMDLSKAVMASDAFFPMSDTVTLASEYGICAIIQPGGSIKDDDSVNVANEHHIAMLKTDIRHFRH